MEKLNEMELSYLQKGIEQERKGVKVHAFMPHETEDLYNSYIWQLQNAAQEIDVLTILACRRISFFWKAYFDVSPEAAKQIVEEDRQNLLESIHQFLEESGHDC